MQLKRLMAISVAAIVLTGSGLALSAEEDPAEGPTPGMGQMRDDMMQDGMMGRGMMGGGMMGMMRMMERCNQMMGSGMMGMPQLPPGNEKLQLQMQAEVMQKVGEILAKYAGQVKGDQESAR